MEFRTMKKALLLAGVACVLCSTSALAGWQDMAKDPKLYVGMDYAFDSYDFGGGMGDAKTSYNSGVFNVGARMDRIGVEVFGQWSGKRTKNLPDDKLKTRVNAYGVDLYGYQPLGCEGKYDLLATVGVADYYFKGEGTADAKSANRIGYRVGAGAMYNMTDHISARVVGRYAYIGAKDLSHAAEVTAGLRYSF